MLNAIVIDDDPVARTCFDAVLRSHALAPTVCADADEAVTHLAGRPCDLWLIDWLMPGTSGIDLVRRIRAGETDHRAYLIMLTARGGDADLAEAFDAGVDDFIAKPVRTVEINARLKAAFRIIHAQQSMTAQLEYISALNENLRTLACEDALTSLLNRRAGLEKLADAWRRAERYDEDLSVALIDIDHFKSINDNHGHDTGDRALRHVANILRSHTRDTDITMRLGGEEFLIVYPRTPAQHAAAHMERIRAVLAASPLTKAGSPIPLTLSAGVCARAPRYRSVDDLISAADAAMYQAKTAGRNRIATAA